MKPSWCVPRRLVRLILSLCAFSGLFAGAARAQEEESAPEIVANLAAGRAVIYVANGGIAVATLENPIEPGAQAPVIVPLNRRRIGVLLGAVDWVQPASGQEVVRLERKLPGLTSALTRNPRLQPEQASDIEQTGLALLELLRQAAESLHGPIDLPPDQPILELLIVDYIEFRAANGASDYTPEVWQLQYRIKQEPLRGDYFQTRVLRPSYMQLYPPEKGHAHPLIEIDYPPDSAAPSVLDLLQRGDPRLARISAAEGGMREAARHLQGGQASKTRVADAADFLRAALAAIAPHPTSEAVAVLKEEAGIEWVLSPPEAKPTPENAEKPSEPRPPGAPTLRKKPPA